jgi:hypothetical protein
VIAVPLSAIGQDTDIPQSRLLHALIHVACQLILSLAPYFFPSQITLYFDDR